MPVVAVVAEQAGLAFLKAAATCYNTIFVQEGN